MAAQAIDKQPTHGRGKDLSVKMFTIVKNLLNAIRNKVTEVAENGPLTICKKVVDDIRYTSVADAIHKNPKRQKLGHV